MDYVIDFLTFLSSPFLIFFFVPELFWSLKLLHVVQTDI